MMIPNRRAALYRMVGTDVYSERQYAVAQDVLCAVVHLNKKALKTSVRADSSASRGSADEFVSTSKILFSANVIIGVEDKLSISGQMLKVMTVEPRYGVDGRHDHNEVDFEQWT